MNETFSGTPALINHRSLLLWSGSLLAAMAAQKAQLLASSATGKNAPSANADNLEHVFDLSPSSWKSWIKEVETLIPKVMRETSVPGCSVVLILDARIYWRHGFGVRGVDTRQPVNIGTVFEAA